MSLQSAGTVLCEPTRLYNILTQCDRSPAVVDETYLLLLDTRSSDDYNEGHVQLAKLAKKSTTNNDDSKYRIPFGAHLPTCLHCVVYDGNTVSVIEDTPATRLANQLAAGGSKNPVLVLKGGYERFSAEYPFLRTQKIMYTPMELNNLPFYPSEIMPLFLYLGDHRHAYNASLNHDLKIHTHVRLGNERELPPALPESTEELHVDVEDTPQSDLGSHFSKIVEFIEDHRKKSERVLVFSELGISRAATAVMAYLIHRNKCSFKEAYSHVEACRQQIRPLVVFKDQLVQWETRVLRPTHT
jgi:serine/threonine/tyrosine-interacting-like protein 1